MNEIILNLVIQSLTSSLQSFSRAIAKGIARMIVMR